MSEASKKYDSQSNSTAERAVQTVEWHVRATLLAHERRRNKVSAVHDVITWLVEHAADILNKVAEGTDGRNAYERIKGTMERVEFHRRVMHTTLCKPQVPAICLGMRGFSDEHLVPRT